MIVFHIWVRQGGINQFFPIFNNPSFFSVTLNLLKLSIKMSFVLYLLFHIKRSSPTHSSWLDEGGSEDTIILTYFVVNQKIRFSELPGKKREQILCDGFALP